MPPYPKAPKARGEWVELLFMTECARRGLKVARPYGDSAAYDVIVEADGRFYRVQVKSTSHRDGHRYTCNCFIQNFKRKSTNGRWNLSVRPYTEENADFIAAYIIPEEMWFIIPVQEVGKTGMSLPAPERIEKGRFGRYFDAWHLLGAGIDIQACADPDYCDFGFVIPSEDAAYLAAAQSRDLHLRTSPQPGRADRDSSNGAMPAFLPATTA